ncbi:Interferon- developmental regulator 1 [Coelomomyces lativittatus]|nr:Interferon- developmental regulator 1 [Coelomomyces lativittatus]KAJ1502106.1 Interferon- developmental regulator 1 [Coelomomyces lativittatus]KAJ1510556.1 Interferon- developmental regulator 1 [Coelomomyces lativittatus]
MSKSKMDSLETMEMMDSEDTMSQCSSSLSLSTSLSEEPVKEDLSSIVDGLLEKRTATREHTLKKLKKLLGTQLLTEELENQIETLQEALLKCLKKSKSGTEMILAAQVLTLLYVTMGMDYDVPLTELQEVLSTKLHSTQSETLLCPLVYLLAVAYFVSEEDMDLALDDHLSFHPFALLAYGALSTLSVHAPTEKTFQFHLKCLTQSPSVKIAALKNLALFHERGHLPSTFHSKIVHALSIKETTSTKQTAQQDRKLLKSMLPIVLATFENHAPPPEEKFHVGKQVIVLTSWQTQLPFELFRQALGSALHFHVLHNPFLHQVLDLEGSMSMNFSSLNKQDKKRMLNPSCEFNKQRTLDRSKQRKQKVNRSNSQFWT